MMRRLAVILWFALAQGAIAGPVSVTSGEHPGFTRLVFDYGAPIDWRFGRSSDGYQIEVTGNQPAYDLRGVFHPIGTTRLAAIWAAPDTGELHIGIACACHAIPFEFRPGVIVVDLRDGPPPAGSSFEAMVDGTQAPALAPPPRPRPKARPRPRPRPADYDWLAQKVDGLTDPTAPAPPFAAAIPPDAVSTAMEYAPLRKLLLTQLSRGAAQGIVEMSHPPHTPASQLAGDFPSAQVMIGGNRGDLSATDQLLNGALSATGKTCLTDEQLAISTWGKDTAIAAQWSSAFADIVGEFDRPDPGAVSRAVKFSLYLGFGAEARQMLDAFGTEPGDAPLWRAMSYVLDDDTGNIALLQGQTACDGEVAFWSALADPPPLANLANKAAIRRTFSALPPHLRNQLGPRLAQRFLQAGDEESARAIRDAILRAGPESLDGKIAVLAAEISSKSGDPKAAEVQLRRIADAGGEGAIEALAGLVELRARRGLPVRAADVTALESAMSEWGGDSAGLSAAVILGRAASGNPAGAFAMLPGHDSLEPELWRLLADLGTDRQILELAVRPQNASPAAAAPETASRIADRLLHLGLAEPAARWAGALPAENTLLRARIALANARPAEAVALLAAQSDAEANSLRVTALRQLGDDRAAAQILASTKDQPSAELALSRAGAWADLAAGESSPLQQVAADAIRPPPDGNNDGQGELARTRNLIGSSEATRDHIGALLMQTPAS